jgi:hypothetical protein
VVSNTVDARYGSLNSGKLNEENEPMVVKLCVTFVLFFLASGCDSKHGNQNASQTNGSQTVSTPATAPNTTPTGVITSPASGPGLIDACALIEKSEIAAVQGAEVQAIKPSAQMNGALAISQCYFSVTSSDGSKNLSVHLEVIQPDPKSPNAVKEYWEKVFKEKGRREGEKEEEEEKRSPPQSVSGVGEEAFWLGNPKAGALYALKKGRMVRVSVGGGDDLKTKIEKSKNLAAKVLKRIA